MTLQEKYNAIQEGSFSKAQFKTDAIKTLPKLVTTFNSYDEVVTILKNKGMITEQSKKVLAEGYSKEEAMEIARVESEGGFVQHVNRLSNGMYRAEDWYDSDNTVATYEDGELVRSYDHLDEFTLDYGTDYDNPYDDLYADRAADAKALKLYDEGEMLFRKGDMEEAEELRQQALSISDWDEEDLPPYGDLNLQEALSTQAIDDLIKKEKDSKIKNKLVKIRGKVLHKKKLSKAETDFAKEVGLLNEEEKKEYKRKVLPNKNRRTSDTISIKSALEKIIQKVWAEPDLVKGKSIVIDFLTNSRINDDSKKTMLANIKDIKTKPRLDSYLANALLAFEKLRVPKSGSYNLRETDKSTTLSEELSKYKEEKGSVYTPAVDNPADAFSSEELNRGIDYELEAAGFDSASPETFTEEDVEKAKKKAIKNLEKNRLHYLNLLAGEKDTPTTHDKMVAVKKDNFVDKENEMKKANLKEAIKKIIVRSLGNTPQALTEGRVQRMWEVGRAYPGYGKALKVEGERSKVTVEFHTGKSHLFEIDSESGIWQEIKDSINESGVNANVDMSLEEFDFMHGLTPVKAEKAMVMAAKLIQRSLDQEFSDDPIMVKSFIVELLSKHLENRL